MPYVLLGGPCSGYVLQDPDGEVLPTWHFAQMWDGILVRDRLNSGEWDLSDVVIGDQESVHFAKQRALSGMPVVS
jgi:hypothetical protein